MTAPAMVCKLIKAGHSSRKLVRYIAGKSVGMTADLGFGVMRLRRPQIHWAIDSLHSFHGSSRAAEVRHVVLSAAKDTPRRAAKMLLRAAWQDWIATYAPGRPWVFGVQFHNGILHGHGGVTNVGPDGKPIKFRPHQVVAMSDMAFTSHGVSSKGIGKKGLSLYTKARSKLVVEDLAVLLVAPGGGIRDEVWEQLKGKEILSDFRKRKDGSIISFSYRGRRIRFSTLERFTDRLPCPVSGSGTAPSAPQKAAQPLPGSLAAKLAAAGFSPKDLERLQTTLRSSSALQTQAAAQKPKKTKQHPSIK